MIDISVVVPVYRSSGTLRELVSRIDKAIASIPATYEIVLVEDCGPDDSWSVIESIVAQRTFPVRAFKLSRNFGQHYAISAGLDHVRGNWTVVMDCDLQDVPEEIPNFYRAAMSGFDIVLGRRQFRKDPLLKKATSAVFYRLLSFLTGTEHDATIANFGIYSRRVIVAVCQLREQIRYFPVMVRWVGFKIGKIDVTHGDRTSGESSYNFFSRFDLAIQTILAYSDRPLRLTALLGIFMSITSLIFASAYLFLALTGRTTVVGWASVFISIWFLTGVVVFVLGVVGLYLGKVFEQVKSRPLYIISENLDATIGTT
jgi:glycosyltransferase involved in cell wall biosynthesis